jgi:hypothetical protein
MQSKKPSTTTTEGFSARHRPYKVEQRFRFPGPWRKLTPRGVAAFNDLATVGHQFSLGVMDAPGGSAPLSALLQPGGMRSQDTRTCQYLNSYLNS